METKNPNTPNQEKDAGNAQKGLIGKKTRFIEKYGTSVMRPSVKKIYALLHVNV